MTRKFIPIAYFLFSSLILQAQNNQQYLKYIEEYKNLAIQQMEKYQIPASITLAQGLYESGAGMSDLARMSNNHFGIKCGSEWKGRSVRHDDDARGECFRSYDQVVESYEDHSKFLKYRSRYAQLFKLDIHDYKGWALGLKKAGYATNPQYANRLISIIEKYQLYKYDNAKYIPAITALEIEKQEIKTDQILAGGKHLIQFKNDVPYIVLRQGDTLNSISKEFRITTKKLLSFNDLLDANNLEPNQRIFLKKKKSHASDEDGYIYIVKEGDSLHSISQQLGIRLKKLYKLNKKNVGDSPMGLGTILRIH